MAKGMADKQAARSLKQLARTVIGGSLMATGRTLIKKATRWLKVNREQQLTKSARCDDPI